MRLVPPREPNEVGDEWGPRRAQRSGSGSKRRRSGESELSAKPEARGSELVPTKDEQRSE